MDRFDGWVLIVAYRRRPILAICWAFPSSFFTLWWIVPWWPFPLAAVFDLTWPPPPTHNHPLHNPFTSSNDPARIIHALRRFCWMSSDIWKFYERERREGGREGRRGGGGGGQIWLGKKGGAAEAAAVVLLWKWGVATSISSSYRMQMTCKFVGQIHHGRCHSLSQHF